jgi:hypothetical protein
VDGNGKEGRRISAKRGESREIREKVITKRKGHQHLDDSFVTDSEKTQLFGTVTFIGCI